MGCDKKCKLREQKEKVQHYLCYRKHEENKINGKNAFLLFIEKHFNI